MSLTPNEAYAAKQPFVDKETLEHIVEQFPTPFHLYDEAGIHVFRSVPCSGKSTTLRLANATITGTSPRTESSSDK